MKRTWDIGELEEHWTLSTDECQAALDNKSDANRLGFALLLKGFEYAGRFPQSRGELPPSAVSYLARQLSLSETVFADYEWDGRTAQRHRAQIRMRLGFHEATTEDAQMLSGLISDAFTALGSRSPEAIKQFLFQQCKSRGIEPPSPSRIDRIIRSGLHQGEERFAAALAAGLTAQAKAGLDQLTSIQGEAIPGVDAVSEREVDAVSEEEDDRSEEDSPGSVSRQSLPRVSSAPVSSLQQLRDSSGGPRLETLLAQIACLETIRRIGIPDGLFASVPFPLMETCKRRISTEELHEIRRHPAAIRHTLLAAFCLLRAEEITDQLADLVCDIVHRIGARAEKRVERVLLRELQKVSGKDRILFRIAQASLGKPEGKVREVIFPVVGEQKLKEVTEEYLSRGGYEQQVQVVMRASYTHHYRRLLPPLLRSLRFGSNRASLLLAVDLLTRYVESDAHFYAADEVVPLDGIVPAEWRPLVVTQTARGQSGARGRDRVNRIAYEMCVLNALRNGLRCKEVWVRGARRYRDPDQDLPMDFPQRRDEHFARLSLPTDAGAFIATEKEALANALAELDRAMRSNPHVALQSRHGKSWVRLTPLTAQDKPVHLDRLKGDISERWGATSLLDILKETDLRVGFTASLKSPTAIEKMGAQTLQRRLLLCLYGLGTNTGLKRVASEENGQSYRDLLYVRRRYLSTDGLREAIARIVNAIFRVRNPTIWGETTTACASDSKKFAAWDQNLLTEWHIRYRGPGIMVYWHVEKKSACIYSQVKSCSSSEVAAMIEGVLRHCTEMTVEKNYVDSHGQSEVAFAFCRLLGFELLPRLKNIHSQKLSRSDTETVYPNLQSALTSTIRWDRIRENYEELVKYTTALKMGIADPEVILSRFTREGPRHPAYHAMIELGKVHKTIFLCRYLASEALRREVHEGLNVIENWNSANSFIFYGRNGEIATNRRTDQELALLCLHLLQVSLVYINTLLVQQVLRQPHWQERLAREDLRALTPLFYGHVTPYGVFRLDLEERLAIETLTL